MYSNFKNDYKVKNANYCSCDKNNANYKKKNCKRIDLRQII